jgi:hypothetical protein
MSRPGGIGKSDEAKARSIAAKCGVSWQGLFAQGLEHSMTNEPERSRSRQSSAALPEDDMGRFVFACLFLLVTLDPSGAADNVYLGTWKISSAVVAPWVDRKQKLDESEKQQLLGKTIELAAKRISGPKPFSCSGPHYKVSNFTADMIFQGAFGEMQTTDKSVDPNKIAASLGFASPGSIKTLETGCEIDFHFIDEATAEIGLNNYVYTLKKQ